MSPEISRRAFAGAAAGFAIVPRSVLGGPAGPAPSDKLNIAGVGIGGMGAEYLKNCETENIAALCDVDDEFAAKTFAKYPEAKRYRDYRKLLDQEKGIDAVVIGTPDHTHAQIALAAISLGKAVYCAKPMTRTISECRAVAKAAREKGVATQMSVQSCGSEKAAETEDWIKSGVIGRVRDVHVWCDRPVWPQGLARPAGSPFVPDSLDWKLWLGGAPERPYNPLYHPFNWRGWHDFGTGALGDMGCHTLHVIVRALGLRLPYAVQATSSVSMEPALNGDSDETWTRSKKLKHPETFADASIVTWDFVGRDRPVRVTWYDGGLRPPRPPEMDPGVELKGDGIFFIGDRGVIHSGFTGDPKLVPESRNASFEPPAKTAPRSKGHYQEWIAAAKGGPPALCNFEFGSQVAEIALLGALAQRTGRYLAWDAVAGRVMNDEAANEWV